MYKREVREKYISANTAFHGSADTRYAQNVSVLTRNSIKRKSKRERVLLRAWKKKESNVYPRDYLTEACSYSLNEMLDSIQDNCYYD